MSIHQLLNTASRAFTAYDAAMNTIGQNVANANSEGYSRRQITLQSVNTVDRGFFTADPGPNANGTGVKVGAYERARDVLLDRSGWHANGFMGASEEEHRVAAALQSIFSVQTEGSLSNQLDNFWSAWSDLADSPSDNGIRLALRSRAASVAGTLNRMSADIQHLQEETERAVASGVEDVNKMLEEIAELNDSIIQARSNQDLDLVSEDRRDVLIKKLSEFANVRVHEASSGGYTVTLDGMTLVAGDLYETLKFDNTGGTPDIKLAGTSVEMRVPSEGGGKLAGLLRSLNTTLPDTLASLDEIAETLVKEVNTIHNGGYNLDGNTNVDFFHYAAGPPEQGVKATSIRLSNAVQASSRAIAASQGDPTTGVNDSTIANEILALRETKLMNAGTESIETFAINFVSDIGATVERASNLYESHAAFANHLDAMAKGVSGVSLEEEMTSLIEFQQAYAASARVVNTAQAMFDSLLNL